MPIYEKEHVMKTLSKVVEFTIKQIEEGKEPPERPMGRLASFIKLLGYSEDDDELILLYILINILPSMYLTILRRLESIKKERPEEESKEIENKIFEIKDKTKDIFLKTLEGLREGLIMKDKKRVMKSLQGGLIRMEREIFRV